MGSSNLIKFLGRLVWRRGGAFVVLGMAVGCGGSGGPPRAPLDSDRELLAAASAAQQAFARGDYALASQQFRRALGRARLADDPTLIGDQAYNLGVSEMALGHWDASLMGLTEAEASLQQVGLPLADVLLVKARLAYRSVEPSTETSRERVARAAEQVLSNPQSKPTASHRLQVALLKTELACDAANATDADARYAEAAAIAVSLPQATEAPSASSAEFSRAGLPRPALAHAAARVRTLHRDWTGAAAAFDLSAKQLSKKHLYAEMTRELIHAAESYQAAGQNDAAATRFYRAARSLASQEKPAQAQSALATAEGLNPDEMTRKLIEALGKELLPISTTRPAAATLPAAPARSSAQE